MSKRDIEEFDDEELETELKRRQEKKRIAAKPKPLKNIDWTPLINMCQEQIDNLHENEMCDEDDRQYIDSDIDHYVYECAMTCVFGANVFKWINRHY